jgi:hypothetical protein
MLSRSAQGNQAPLFFGLVWGVVKCFGVTEVSLRLVSLVAAILTMLIAARLVYLWTDSPIAATVVVALIAVDDTFIWYATEARPYALLHLLGLLQISAFCYGLFQLIGDEKIGDNNEARGAKIPWSFVVLSVALLFSHYTSVFLLVAEFVVLAGAVCLWRVNNKQFLRGSFGSIGWAIVMIVAASNPLLLQMRQAFGQPGDWQMVASPALYLQEQGINLIAWFLIPVASLLFVWLIGSLGGGANENSINSPPNETFISLRQFLLALAAVYFLPIMFLFVLAKTGIVPIAMSRYLSSSVIAGPVFAGLIFGCLSKKQQIVAVAFLLLATSIYHVYSNRLVVNCVAQGRIPLLRIEDWPAAIRTINQTEAKQTHLVFLFGSVIEDAGAFSNGSPVFQSYLQFPVDSIYPLRASKRVFAGPTVAHPHFSDDAIHEICDQGGAWILVRHHRDHARSIASELLQRLHPVAENQGLKVDVAEFGSQQGLIQLISIDIAAAE